MYSAGLNSLNYYLTLQMIACLLILILLLFVSHIKLKTMDSGLWTCVSFCLDYNYSTLSENIHLSFPESEAKATELLFSKGTQLRGAGRMRVKKVKQGRKETQTHEIESVQGEWVLSFAG
jgi:hypothetical protein